MGKSDTQRSGAKGFLGVPTLAISCAVVLALAIGGAIIATHDSSAHASGTLATGNSKLHHHPSKAHHKKVPPAPLRVVAVTPVSNAATAAWGSDVTIQFSEPLAASSILPIIRPAVPGSWDRVGTKTLVFRPVGHWVPFTKETVYVPKRVMSTYGTILGKALVSQFTVNGASVLRLQELLAELGYLPVAFIPAPGGAAAVGTHVSTSPAPAFSSPSSPPGGLDSAVVAAPGPGATSDTAPSVAGAIALAPVAGHFAWRFNNIPTMLANQWSAGVWNEVTTGAVMAFESANNLDDDGIAGALVWQDLLQAVAARTMTTAPYDYVYVSEGSPEYVTVWRDGVNVYTTLANTGIPQAPTVAGTWPVYVRYLTTTMSGVNPDGTHYSDPGIPWVSYFHGGDALHGYIRASYGFPQSLGCVEMPYSDAETVFPYTPLGTLVTVE